MAVNGTRVMLNALKTPGHFTNAVADLNSESVSKSKRYVLAVFFVLFGVAVITFFLNQKEKQGSETMASSGISQENPVAPPSEKLETRPSPDKNKPEPARQEQAIEPVQSEPASGATASSSVKEDKKGFTFKSDKEYLAMNRFERPLLEARTPVVTVKGVREPTAVVDKPLVLAGRGFDIQQFQSPSRQVVQADFLQHLKRPVPKIKPVLQERLDLQLKQAKSSKHLIFHPLGSALSQLQKPTLWEDPESQKKPQDLESIPETKLLFSESENSQLILRPRRESLDLLIGNEKLNRKEYGSW